MSINSDLKKLTTYPEYYILKQELIKFCDSMDNISDIKLNDLSRVPIEAEIVGRRFASDKVKALLVNLGLLEEDTPKRRDRTFE